MDGGHWLQLGSALGPCMSIIRQHAYTVSVQTHKGQIVGAYMVAFVASPPLQELYSRLPVTTPGGLAPSTMDCGLHIEDCQPNTTDQITTLQVEPLKTLDKAPRRLYFWLDSV